MYGPNPAPKSVGEVIHKLSGALLLAIDQHAHELVDGDKAAPSLELAIEDVES